MSYFSPNISSELSRAIFLPSSLLGFYSPSPSASVISLRSESWQITERFESLLRRGRSPIPFNIPLRLFEMIPLQHVQMNLGILNLLSISIPLGRISQNLSKQILFSYPALQCIFQNLIQGLKIQAPLSSPVSQKRSEDNTSFLSSIRTELQQKIYTPEPETLRKLEEVNTKRAKEGKAPIDFQATTREIESIMNNASLSDKEKNKKIAAIRKRLGLGKKDMKTLFTKRLAKIYQEAAQKIKNYLNHLKEQVVQAEKRYGKNSPEATVALQRLKSAEQSLGPTLQKFESQSKLYNGMFRSFWSKIGGFFKAIGKGLLKVGKIFSKIMNFISPFLRFIPGIGQMISFGWGALKGLVQLVKGNWKGFLGKVFGILGSGIPGIGTIAPKISSLVSKVIPVVRGIFDAVNGNFTGLVRTGLNWATRIPGIGPALSMASKYLRSLISPLRQTPDPLQEGVPPGAIS